MPFYRDLVLKSSRVDDVTFYYKFRSDKNLFIEQLNELIVCYRNKCFRSFELYGNIYLSKIVEMDDYFS